MSVQSILKRGSPYLIPLAFVHSQLCTTRLGVITTTTHAHDANCISVLSTKTCNSQCKKGHGYQVCKLYINVANTEVNNNKNYYYHYFYFIGYESNASERSALRVLLCCHCFLFVSGVRLTALCCFLLGRLLFLLRACMGELVSARVDSPEQN